MSRASTRVSTTKSGCGFDAAPRSRNSNVSQNKSRALSGPGSVMSARDGRQSPSRGELTAGIGLANLGGCDNPAPTAQRNNAARRVGVQRKAPHDSHATLAKVADSMTAMRTAQAGECFESAFSIYRKVYVARKKTRRDQKLQRCALLTRKSRNACTRATDLSSSG